MRICLLGKNLTNLVLANNLANKKLNVDIYYTKSQFLHKNDSSRTLAISYENFVFLKENNKSLNIRAWPSERIKIYVVKKKNRGVI